MRTRTIFKLSESGDTRITWDPENAESVATARKECAELKARGYEFFLIDGTPADAVQAGLKDGALVCRLVDGDRVVDELSRELEEESAEFEASSPKRGRKPKKRVAEETHSHVSAVAHRRSEGG